MSRSSDPTVFRDLDDLVRVKCRAGLDSEDGWVVGVGRKWLLLQQEWDAGTDGWVAIRHADVRRITRRHKSFIPTAVKLVGEPVCALDGVDLDRTTPLLQTAQQVLPLIGIVERRYNDLKVGRITGFDGGRVLLLEIDPRARWDTEPTPIRVQDIAKVELGGRYLDRLAMVAEQSTS